MIKKFDPAVIFFFLALVTAYSANAQEENVLNVYNWADYIAPNTIADFEAEFGIRVNYDLYDSTEIVDAKLLAGQTGYDVVVHAARYSARLIQGVPVREALGRSAGVRVEGVVRASAVAPADRAADRVDLLDARSD